MRRPFLLQPPIVPSLSVLKRVLCLAEAVECPAEERLRFRLELQVYSVEVALIKEQ